MKRIVKHEKTKGACVTHSATLKALHTEATELKVRMQNLIDMLEEYERCVHRWRSPFT
jgi:hypothetical protein